MTNSYLQNSLLQNPVKWLRGITKRHASDLYLNNYYCASRTDRDPFLKLLLDTRQDVSRVNFPIGIMMQIVVTKDPVKKSYSLLPVLKKPTRGQNPASYVISNKSYVDFLSQKQFFPVPLKYKHKNSSVISSIAAPVNFGLAICELYEKRVKELMVDVLDEAYVGCPKCDGVSIEKSDTTDIIWRPESKPIIYSKILQHDTFLKNEYHEELILLFFRAAALEII